MDKAAFKAKYRALQERFMEKAHADEAVLPSLLTAIEAAGDAYAEPLRRLYIVAHQYNGNGLTFGFPVVSKAASALEAFVEGIKSKEALQAHWAQIETLVAALATELGRTALPEA